MYSPPPDYDHLDRRKSRRDMSPLQKPYMYVTAAEKKYGYEPSLKVTNKIEKYYLFNIFHTDYVTFF